MALKNLILPKERLLVYDIRKFIFRRTFSRENTGFDENLAKLPEVVGHWFQCPTRGYRK